jgi:DNA-binding PadR family transcriptional regulator
MDYTMHPFFHRIHEAFHHHHHLHHRHASRRDGGFAGFGSRGGPSFPGDAFHGGGLGRGRKLGSAGLQLLLLALLAEKPSHGYELIKALDERSNGYYSPSPGMVYPALTYLEEIGHASVETQGTKKLYSITEAGLTHLESQRAAVDALLEQLAWIGKRMDDVRRAMSGAEAPDASADFDSPHAFPGHGRGRPEAGTPEVRQARRNLKSALIEKAGATVAEQRRIAQILDRAAAEIRSGSTAAPDEA